MEFRAGQTQQVVIRNLAGRFQTLQGDALTGALMASEVAQAMVHAGRFFTVPDIDEAVAPGGPKQWLFITPDAEDMLFHMNIRVAASKQARAELFEAAVATDNGNALDPMNHKRSSTYESQLLAFEDATISDEGDRLDVGSVGTSGGEIKIGGAVCDGAGWDLKPNTVYLLKVTSGAADNIVTMTAEYYEFDTTDTTFVDPASSSSSA